MSMRKTHLLPKKKPYHCPDMTEKLVCGGGDVKQINKETKRNRQSET